MVKEFRKSVSIWRNYNQDGAFFGLHWLMAGFSCASLYVRAYPWHRDWLVQLQYQLVIVSCSVFSVERRHRHTSDDFSSSIWSKGRSSVILHRLLLNSVPYLLPLSKAREHKMTLVFTGRVGYTGDQHGPWMSFLTVVSACPRPMDTGNVYRALIAWW